ncbi:MAG: YggS family pyridoxal phosphate-dependent enzyme [Acidobacteria bacterium]|nr:YggS family pyridoxal phosphate-dependent enzyme [Acidobacteriota bacterium]
MISERLSRVQERIAQAARQAGRNPDEITLVAVSKTKPAADIRAVYEAGQRQFGENYIQDFDAKSGELGDLPEAVFHFIGKLQSNKTKQAARLFQVIQTVDSIKLARRLNDCGEPLDVFLEVKLSTEESKGGLEETKIAEVADYVRGLSHLSLRGLMTMPPWSEDSEAARPYFRRLRALGEQHNLAELSMGMSHDLEVAIEEGSTLVRVGTAIFGERTYKA